MHERSSRCLLTIRVRPARQGTGHDEIISVGALGGTNEDASLPRRPRRMSHRLTRLAASVFGSLATIVRGKQTLGPELCVPDFRPVCPYRDTSPRTPMTRTRLSGPSRIRPVLCLLCSFHTVRMLLRRPRRLRWAEPRTRCLLRDGGAGPSGGSSSSGALATAGIAKIAESGTPHMHNCTTPAGIRPGMSCSPAPRFGSSEPSRPVSLPRNKHRVLTIRRGCVRARPERFYGKVTTPNGRAW